MSTPERVNKLKAAMAGMGSVQAPTPAPVVTFAAKPSVDVDRTTLAPSRRGKRNVSAYVDAAAAKQLRLLAVDLDTSIQALVEEALNDLFRKHGKSAIA
jgi:hypothetical protein